MKKRKSVTYTSRGKVHQILVRGMPKPEPDFDKLARVLLGIARENHAIKNNLPAESAEEYIERRAWLDEIALEMKLLDQRDKRNDSSKPVSFE